MPWKPDCVASEVLRLKGLLGDDGAARFKIGSDVVRVGVKADQRIVVQEGKGLMAQKTPGS